MGSSASKQTLKSSSAALKIPISLNKLKGAQGAIPKTSTPSAVHSPTQQSINKITSSSYTRPDGHDPQSANSDGPDPEFAERLRKLGTVKFKNVQQTYPSSNEMLGAVQSRQRLDQESDQLMKKQQTSPMDPKSLIHPETITAILQSRQEGDSDDKIREDFNLNPRLLELLGTRLSIPKIVKPAKEERGDSERESVFRKEQVEDTGPVLER